METPTSSTLLNGARLLIVDDERTTRLSLSEIFTLRGAQVTTAADGQEAIDLLRQFAFDLIVLDLKMPGMSGLQVLEEAQRIAPATVVILLTAHASVDSAISALRRGVFDYVLKPAQPRMIVEAVERGLIKRQEYSRRQNLVGLMEQTVSALKGGQPSPGGGASPAATSTGPIQIGPIRVDLKRREARLSGDLLVLTPTEFDTLAYLVQHADRVVSCRELVRAVHGYDTTEREARPIMRVHIHRLRQKIEADAMRPERLLTVRAAGYMLVVEPRWRPEL
ncbi:MAG TPA: response regulator transcription factor [Anaerolineae bacterium]|nr:response regulator transcription factor [Anaerolineae bacterium]